MLDKMLNLVQEILNDDLYNLPTVFDYLEIPVVGIDSHEKIQIFNGAAELLYRMKANEVLGKNIAEVLNQHHLVEVMEKRKPQSTIVTNLAGETLILICIPLFNKYQTIGALALAYQLNEVDAIINEFNSVKQLYTQINAIFESSFDGLYITDGKANTLRLNKSFERITGLRAEQCIGRNMRELVEKGIYSRSATLIALEKRKRIMTTLETNTGKTVLATSNPIFDKDGSIVMVVTDVCDITELIELQRKTEEAEDEQQCEMWIDAAVELDSPKKIIAHSKQMRELINICTRIATTSSNVLIQGESGVGKELIADLIHLRSNRSHGPLIKVNCGAIPENLLESELFGYEAGAFTGASKDGKKGFFELASGGTLFLDEIGDLPLNLQVKLLRAIQEREFIRVGGVKPVKTDIRIVSATNRNLDEMVIKGEFRQDLYYRLNVIPIYVPALRERPEDIPALSEYFLKLYNTRLNMKKQLSPDILSCFMDYNWPGNIRELENFIERLIVTSVHDTITVADLLYHTDSLHFMKKNEQHEDIQIVPMRYAVENVERELLQKAFDCYASTYEIAEVLEINQSTVVRKAAKYGIKRQSIKNG